jgi:nitrate reductase NapE component
VRPADTRELLLLFLVFVVLVVALSGGTAALVWYFSGG